MLQIARTSCPRCRLPLRIGPGGHGFAYACDSCSGQAVSTAVVRKLVGPAAYREFWSRTRQGAETGATECPLCQHPMNVLRFPEHQQLDFCGGCQFVWLDRGERKELPPAPPGDERVQPPNPHVALAVLRFEQEQARRVASLPSAGFEPPDELWKTIPILIGLPTEVDCVPTLEPAWVTWGLLAVCGGALAVTWRRPDLITTLALVPADAWRWSGATWITSVFLHGGLVHFLGNAYFLFVFGDNVEEDLGRLRFLGLFLAAGLVGNAAHVLLDPRSDLPLVGASGAISGVLVYYVLKFPRHRLGMRLYRSFVTWPAWYFLVFWLGMQSIVVLFQLVGASNVSALGHLGGAAMGLLAWLLWRNRPPVGAWPR